jgi:hypothetical protein
VGAARSCHGCILDCRSGTLLFVIGRGLHAGRAWARVSGILVALGLFLCSLLVVTSFRQPLPMSLGALGMAAAGYVVWVLGWRFV